MRKAFYFLATLIPIIVIVGAVSLSFSHALGAKAANPICTQTGFMRDSINLTAAVIPTSTNPNVSGVINATGCNIGVYYGPGLTGMVKNAEVYGANYFGIVNNGSTVTVTQSRVHDIGEVPFNGVQHGVGIYFAYDIGAKGSITYNTVWNYQKGGIVVNGVGSTATIGHNTVLGMGPINYIAQNGIEVGIGAKATVSGNYVSGNAYTGSGEASSGGILLFGGTCYGGSLTIGTHITGNTLRSNDVGIWLSNGDVDPNSQLDCLTTQTPTRDVVSNNTSSDDAVTNTTGLNLYGQCCVYQAGISDQGDYDKVTNNSTCGVGYTTPSNPPPYLYMIDDTDTSNIIESGNTTCGNISTVRHAPKTQHTHMLRITSFSI